LISMPPPKQLLTFKSQGRHYACDLLWVHEILRRPALTPVRRAPPEVRGLVHLRGQILTALDLDQRLGYPPPERPADARCIVFKTAAELSRLAHPPADADQAGQDLVGILVDAIGDILADSGTLLPPPAETLTRLDSLCIQGVITRPEGLVALLNVGRLLTPSSLLTA
jgi:purine-binding chemotaxis protein CheW